MGLDPAVLAAEQGFEDREAVGEAGFEAANLLGLLVGNQAIHGQRHDHGRAEGDGQHHQQKE